MNDKRNFNDSDKDICSSSQDYYSSYLKTENRVGAIGLKNLGNTCFMNSSLQCLGHLPSFIEEIKSLSKKMLKEKNLINVLADLFVQMENKDKEYKSETLLKDTISLMSTINKKYSLFNQQDANEFISLLLFNLNRQIKSLDITFENKYINKKSESQEFKNMMQRFFSGKSFIESLFYGKIKKVIQCPRGHELKHIYQIFTILELSFIEGNSPKDLKKMLMNYQDNQYYDDEIVCPMCNNKNYKRCRQQTLIYDLPKYFIVHFNKNEKKEYQKINYDLELSYSEITYHKDTNIKYELIGVIKFTGVKGFGHYTSICYNHFDEKYYKFNDYYFKEVGQKDLICDNANILFYERIN